MTDEQVRVGDQAAPPTILHKQMPSNLSKSRWHFYPGASESEIHSAGLVPLFSVVTEFLTECPDNHIIGHQIRRLRHVKGSTSTSTR